MSIMSDKWIRKMAEEHGIDLSTVKGSGQQGRVTKSDMEAVLARRGTPSAPSAAPLLPTLLSTNVQPLGAAIVTVDGLTAIVAIIRSPLRGSGCLRLRLAFPAAVQTRSGEKNPT